METIFIEATNGPRANWGKFMVARFDEEWQRKSIVDDAAPLLRTIGWGSDHIIVFDLQTCEGAGFRPGGNASADLNKHHVWVCPLFEPFLDWLYKQDLSDLNKLPKSVNLPEAEFAFRGHRREGK